MHRNTRLKLALTLMFLLATSSGKMFADDEVVTGTDPLPPPPHPHTQTVSPVSLAVTAVLAALGMS